jgi:hypothetical protein
VLQCEDNQEIGVPKEIQRLSAEKNGCVVNKKRWIEKRRDLFVNMLRMNAVL